MWMMRHSGLLKPKQEVILKGLSKGISQHVREILVGNAITNLFAGIRSKDIDYVGGI